MVHLRHRMPFVPVSEDHPTTHNAYLAAQHQVVSRRCCAGRPRATITEGMPLFDEQKPLYDGHRERCNGNNASKVRQSLSVGDLDHMMSRLHFLCHRPAACMSSARAFLMATSQ